MNKTDTRAPSVDWLELFAVPMAVIDAIVPPATDAELARWVLRERSQDAGVQRSNHGGWHSRPDLPVRAVPALDRLFQAMVDQVGALQARLAAAGRAGDGGDRVQLVLQAWATVMEKGHHVAIHDHGDAHWSAVYYVDAGDGGDPASGRISWINPVGAVRSLPGLDLAPTTFACSPRSGQLLVFPGWLRHCVEPYLGDRPRIAIAANFELRRAQSHGLAPAA